MPITPAICWSTWHEPSRLDRLVVADRVLDLAGAAREFGFHGFDEFGRDLALGRDMAVRAGMQELGDRREQRFLGERLADHRLRHPTFHGVGDPFADVMGEKQQRRGDVLATEPDHEFRARHVLERELADDEVDAIVCGLDCRCRGEGGRHTDVGVFEIVLEQIAVVLVRVEVEQRAGELCWVDAFGREQLRQRVGVHERSEIDLLVELDPDLVDHALAVLTANDFALHHDGALLGVRQRADTPGAVVHECAVQETRPAAREVPARHLDLNLRPTGVDDGDADRRLPEWPAGVVPPDRTRTALLLELVEECFEFRRGQPQRVVPARFVDFPSTAAH